MQRYSSITAVGEGEIAQLGRKRRSQFTEKSWKREVKKIWGFYFLLKNSSVRIAFLKSDEELSGSVWEEVADEVRSLMKRYTWRGERNWKKKRGLEIHLVVIACMQGFRRGLLSTRLRDVNSSRIWSSSLWIGNQFERVVTRRLLTNINIVVHRTLQKSCQLFNAIGRITLIGLNKSRELLNDASRRRHC